MHNRRLVTIVLVALGLGFGATAVLASMYRDVRRERTARHIERGRTLAEQNDLLGAVEEYGAALLLERDDPEATRALALTLLSLNRLSEAESYLSELLRDEPTSGVLNRSLARVHAALGRETEARVSYQRAIYGEWNGDSVTERTNTRFELIDHLRRVDARDEVLAELLRLRAELPPDRAAAARRVADLLVEQGAADLAIETLRSTAATASRDVELLAQLADLETREHRLSEARTTLRRALAIEPNRKEVSERLLVVDRILALDPTLPGLRLVTRTRRARLVLQAVVEQTRRCADDARGETADLADTATRQLRQRRRANAEAAERDLELAAQLWSRSPGCHGKTPDARALSHVLDRVAQEGRS